MKPKETDFEPQTLGEHVRKRRLELRLTQKQAAERLGVNPWTVLNWEKDRTAPPIKSMPVIIRFLGYAPFLEPKNIPERLLAKRRAMGWSIKEAARQLGVDEGMWGDWKRGGVILDRNHRLLVARLLDLPRGETHQDMGVCLNRLHKDYLSPRAACRGRSEILSRTPAHRSLKPGRDEKDWPYTRFDHTSRMSLIGQMG